MSSVTLKSVIKTFGAGRAVDSLDLEIESGEFFVLLGPSGCGKTTTLRCIAGLEEPDGGSIGVGGRTMAEPRRGIFVPPHKRALSMVFQNYGLWPHMSVFSNVAYPLRSRRIAKSAFPAEVAEALDLVGLSGLEDRYPYELSGGQQQRVALARAIVTKPSLLLFDEPLSNLDAQLRTRLRYDLKEIHRKRAFTAVYVTHDQSEALALADRVAIMRSGRIEQMGTPIELFRSPKTPFAAEFVGYENFLPGMVTATHRHLATVRSEAWGRDLTGRYTDAVAVGSKVWVAMRAADVAIARVAPAVGEVNIASAVIGGVTYLGDRFQCLVKIGDTTLVGSMSAEGWSGEEGAHRIAAGQKVSVTTSFNDLIVMPRDDRKAESVPIGARKVS
jgi:iron(III) transport system ATP-binding protein